MYSSPLTAGSSAASTADTLIFSKRLSNRVKKLFKDLCLFLSSQWSKFSSLISIFLKPSSSINFSITALVLLKSNPFLPGTTVPVHGITLPVFENSGFFFNVGSFWVSFLKY